MTPEEIIRLWEDYRHYHPKRQSIKGVYHPGSLSWLARRYKTTKGTISGIIYRYYAKERDNDQTPRDYPRPRPPRQGHGR